MKKYYPANAMEEIDPRDHLLFDLGFSYGLLMQAHHLLSALRPGLPPSVRTPIDQYLTAYAEFQAGRQQVRDDIYAAAERLPASIFHDPNASENHPYG